MDHYFIHISEGEIADVESVLINDYICSLTATAESINYCQTVITNLASLLKLNGIYVAHLKIFEEHDQNLCWKKFKKETIVNHLISAFRPSVEETHSENQIKNALQKVSSNIHMLADLLPCNGLYKLDVIINYDLLKISSLRYSTEFLSSLYRLTRWHQMHAVVLVIGEYDPVVLGDWCQVMNAEILDNRIDPCLGFVLWRGSIQLQNSNTSQDISFEGFQLKLDLAESADFSMSPEGTCITEPNECVVKQIILSPVLQIVDECSFTSIPSYMISPLVFRLIVSEPNILNEISSNLLKYLFCKKGLTLIARMNFMLLAEEQMFANPLCTKKWKRAISSGCIKNPDMPMEILNHITLAITQSSKTDNIVAYLLKDSRNIDANFYIINSEFNLWKENMKKKKEEDYLRDFKFSYIDVFPRAISKRPKLCLLKNDEIDSSDWPERIYLFQKQIESEDGCRLVPSSMLKQSQQIFLSSEDILKCFKSTGEAKDLASAEVIYSLRSRKMCSAITRSTVLQKMWPEILNYVCEDIYYNCTSQTEEREAMNNQMVKFYVQDETACTCNKQQLKIDSLLTISISNSSITGLRWKSPKKRFQKEGVNDNYKTKLNIHCKSKETVGSSLDQASHHNIQVKDAISASSNKKVFKNKVSCNGCSKNHITESIIDSIGSSPGMKTLVNCKKPSVLRSRISRKCQINKPLPMKSKNLPEKLRKKLRVAVAEALESQGINLNDKMFKPCGKRLFAICQAFVQDISIKKGSTSQRMQQIADAHVKQVIEFEMQEREQAVDAEL